MPCAHRSLTQGSLLALELVPGTRRTTPLTVQLNLHTVLQLPTK